jgi:hypothetical protein
MNTRSVPLRPPLRKKTAKPAKTVELKSVKSSFIRAIGHDADRNLIHVEMLNGDVYEYPGSADEHSAFASAESLGKHFSAHIRGREFTRRRPDKAA